MKRSAYGGSTALQAERNGAPSKSQTGTNLFSLSALSVTAQLALTLICSLQLRENKTRRSYLQVMTAATSVDSSVHIVTFQNLEQVVRDKAAVKTLRNLALQLRRRQISGPLEVANATAKALRQLVSTSKCQDVQELVQLLRSAGRFLQEAQPGGENSRLRSRKRVS